MKICTKCGKVKEEGEFHKDKNRTDGLHPQCKPCQKEYQKEYYKQNKDKIKEQGKEYWEQNKEKIKEYREQNKDKMKEQSKEYIRFSALYNTFAHQISYAEEVRQDPDNGELLQVKCTFCKEWFNPINGEVRYRIRALEGRGTGENRLYCSDGCKKLCPIHHQHKYPKGQKPYPIPRDTQAQWAEMVKERDGYRCIKCGSTEDLIAHHKEGIRWNPLESADIDIGVTLCSKCDKEAHSIEGCSPSDMRCNSGGI